MYVAFVTAAGAVAEYYGIFIILTSRSMSSRDKTVNLLFSYVVATSGMALFTGRLSATPNQLHNVC